MPLIDRGHSEHKKLGRIGEADGLENLPPSDSKALSETERQFLERSAESWRNFKSQLSSEQYRISRDLSTIGSKISHEVEPSETNYIQEQKKSLELLEAESGEGSTVHNSLKSAFEETERNLDEVKIQLGRPLSISFKSAYIPIMAVLSFAELYINKLSFELVFESQPFVSFMLAAAVGILLIFFAHIIGTQFKRSQCPITAFDNSKSYWGILFVTVISLFLMYSLAMMRQQLLDLSATEINLDQMLLDDSDSAMGGSTSWGLSKNSIPFLIINFAVFVSGVILAFFRHDAHPFYEKYMAEHLFAKNAFLIHMKKYEKKQVEILREFNSRLSENSQIRLSVEKNIKDLETQKRLLSNAEDEFRERYISEILRCLSEYRTKNTAARKTPIPAYFTSPLEPQVRAVIS